MKIAISATGKNLDAEVDPRFGRCQYFIIIDPETMQFEALENSSAMASGGAGISAAQMIAGKGVEAVLTGKPLSAETIAQCVVTARAEIAPITDVRAGEAYRREVVGVMLRRMLERARGD